MKKLLLALCCAFVTLASAFGAYEYTEKDVMIDVGDHQIPATVTIPTAQKKGEKFPAVVMLHGNGTNRHEANNAYDYAAPELAKAGIATIRFDYIGNGDSTGDYVDFTYTKGMEDAMACRAYIRSQEGIKKNKIGIMGWSQGGRIALITAGTHNHSFKSVLTWAGAYGQKDLSKEYEEAKRNGYFEKTYSWRDPLKQGVAYYEDAMSIDYARLVSKIKCPLLAINGKDDTTVVPETAQKIVDATGSKKAKVLLVDDCDHTLKVFTGDLTKLHEVTQATVDWFAETL